MATITVSEFATELDTDPRTARKFLRSVTPADDQPGKGSRWAIEKRDIRSLRSKFTKWTTAQEAAKNDRIAQNAEKATKVTITEEVPETDDSLDSLEGPTDDEMLDED